MFLDESALLEIVGFTS